MPLAAGARLGHYEIVSPLGAGGMGEVYRALDTRLGREVAVKVLPAQLSADGDRLRRFEQEARATSALTHPHILSIFDVGTHEGMPYIVSELLEGETLREAMGGRAVPPRKALDWAVQLAHALAAAHDKGIVHRDLKPENLFVTRESWIKVLDFGLARLTDPAVRGDATATREGAVLGSVGYMAPEQVRGEPADARADVFAFGAVLSELLSGNRAFRRGSPVETMNAILTDPPAPLPAELSGGALERVPLGARPDPGPRSAPRPGGVGP
jgi:eukaryotic-like serine/threonine-protein kinase